eukprot:EG_transcript_2864
MAASGQAAPEAGATAFARFLAERQLQPPPPSRPGSAPVRASGGLVEAAAAEMLLADATRQARSYAGARLRTPKSRKVQWPQYWQSATYHEAVLRRPPFFTGAADDTARSPCRSPVVGRQRRRGSGDRSPSVGPQPQPQDPPLAHRPTSPGPAELSIAGLGMLSGPRTRNVAVQTDVDTTGWPGLPLAVVPSVTPAADDGPSSLPDVGGGSEAAPAPPPAPGPAPGELVEPRASVRSGATTSRRGSGSASQRGSSASRRSSSASAAPPSAADSARAPAPGSQPATPHEGLLTPPDRAGMAEGGPQAPGDPPPAVASAEREKAGPPAPPAEPMVSQKALEAARRSRMELVGRLGRLECLLMALEDEDRGVGPPSQAHCSEAIHRAAEHMQYVALRLRESAHAPTITAIREELQMTFKRANDVTLENLKRMIHVLLKAQVEKEERRKVTSDFTEAWSGFRTEFELCISVVLHSIVDLEAAMRCTGLPQAGASRNLPEPQTAPSPIEQDLKGSSKATSEAPQHESGSEEPAGNPAASRDPAALPRSRSLRIPRSTPGEGSNNPPLNRTSSRGKMSHSSGPPAGGPERSGSLRLGKGGLSRQRGNSDSNLSKARVGSPGAKAQRRGPRLALEEAVIEASLSLTSADLSSWIASEQDGPVSPPPTSGDAESSAPGRKPVSPDKGAGDDPLDFLEISREVSVFADPADRRTRPAGDAARLRRGVTVHFDPIVEVSEAPTTQPPSGVPTNPPKALRKPPRKRSASSPWETLLHSVSAIGEARPDILPMGSEVEDPEDVSPAESPSSGVTAGPSGSRPSGASAITSTQSIAPFQGSLPTATRPSRSR